MGVGCPGPFISRPEDVFCALAGFVVKVGVCLFLFFWGGDIFGMGIVVFLLRAKICASVFLVCFLVHPLFSAGFWQKELKNDQAKETTSKPKLISMLLSRTISIFSCCKF